MSLTETIIHEDGDRVYLIAPVSPITPTAAQIEEYAFGTTIVQDAARENPNPFLKWYGGHYVEADKPNGNGAMWTAKELAIKALTPRFMPVTVMHDPSTAVGIIADVALLTPEVNQVPRSKIETALALWAHRFPEVIEECAINYEQGTLMQSMEAIVPEYECAVCGLHYLKLPKGAERANWCAHLKGEEGSTAVRILAATTFTGTGLIFGTRGATGADPLAHLEDFKQEVAEFHQRQQAPKTTPTRSKLTMEIQIDKAEYDALQARPTMELLDTERARADAAEHKLEASEAQVVTLTTESAAKDTKIAELEQGESARVLATERLSKLGTGFMAKLGETAKAKLPTQAASMQDAEWTERVAELAEMTGVAPDTATTETAAGAPVFTPEETARMGVAGGMTTATNDAPLSRNVMQGLIRRPAKGAKSA